VFGGIGWVVSMTMAGFTLGKIFPGITKRLDMIIVGIVVVSLLPAFISWFLNRRKDSPTSPTLAM